MAYQNTYRLTFRDAYTGRSITGNLPGDMELYQVASDLEQRGILSFPKRYISIPGVQTLERCGAHFPDVNDIPGVRSGMTLEVDIAQAKIPRIRSLPTLRKTYPLVFCLMRKKICVKKFQFLCYGYEKPDDIIDRLREQKLLEWDSEIGYRILQWPTYAGFNPTENYHYTDEKFLCEIDPPPGRSFLIEQYKIPFDSSRFACMYGCPAAALPEQENALQNRTVDVITFD